MTHVQYNTDGTLMPQTLTRKAMEMKKTSADVVCPTNFPAKSPLDENDRYAGPGVKTVRPVQIRFKEAFTSEP